MKVKIIGLLLLGILSSTSPVWAWTADEPGEFEQANQLYRDGKFSEAAGKYEKLLEKAPRNAALNYNLGNSYYRAGQRGKSILHYEKALAEAPRNRDIRHNLEYVKGLLEYRIEDKRNWYLRAGERSLGWFRESEITLAALVSFALFAGLWCLALYVRHETLYWDWKTKTLLFLCVVTFLFWGAKHIETRVMRDAIVVSNEAEVRYGPSDTDQIAFRLGEGIKVFVIDQRHGWKRGLLVNGEGGWIRDNQITEVMR